MKRKSRIKKLIIAIVVILCLGGIATYLVLGLGLFTKKEVVKEAVKTYTVASGNLTTEISAAGNLALAETEDVSFEMAGTVLEVLVNVGDTVTKGQELARLDTTDLEKTIKTLDKAITTAQRALALKETALENAKRTVTSQERQISAKEMAVTDAKQAVTEAEQAVAEAKLAVQSAEDDLYNIKEVADVQAKLDKLENTLGYIDQIMEGISISMINVNYMDWYYLRKEIVTEINQTKADLQDIITDNGVQLSSDVALQIAQANLAIEKKKFAVEKADTALEKVQAGVEDAQIAVDNAEYAVQEAQASVASAESDVEDAKSSLQDANDALAEAQSLSSVVTAPFDGFIPSISVKGGAEVQKGTVAMQVASQDKFKVELAVSEDDISNIAVDGKAYVTVDSLDVTLPASVTYIAPTATISSGVVNYSVRVELQEITFPQIPAASGNSTNMPSFSSSANITPPAGFGGKIPAMAMKTIKLRQGLTVTVDLVIAEAKNVLLVPYAAVKAEGMTKYVEVMKDDGTTEKRTVTTGLTDYSTIVITDGLTAGEKIVYSGAVAAASTSSSGQFPQGGFIGMGGFPRGD
jgi:multidrug efflux pump subunit AcrA (membrane-fusion protein)